MRQIACKFHYALTASGLAISLATAGALGGMAASTGAAFADAGVQGGEAGNSAADRSGDFVAKILPVQTEQLTPRDLLPMPDGPTGPDGEGAEPLPYVELPPPAEGMTILPEAEGGTNEVAADPAAAPPSSDDIDQLFAELAAPEGDAWIRAQSDIQRIWSRSGSASMDLLYKRGEEALDAGDLAASIGHLTALTDHAPDFASGWYLRAVAYYLDGEFGPAVADLGMTLQLEPRHFMALTQLGSMLEETGDDKRALDAYRASLKINPHQQEAVDAVTRLEQKAAGTDA